MISTMLPAGNDKAPAAVPARFSVSEILSQDVVTAEGVPVDIESPRPIAAFENIIVDNGNRVEGGHAHEALVIERVDNARRRLVHVRFDSTSATGWSVTHLHREYEPTEVAVTVDRKPGQRGEPETKEVTCYFMAAKKLYSSTLAADGKTWNDPVLCHDREVRPGLQSGHLSSLMFRDFNTTDVGEQAGTVTVRTAGDQTGLMTYGRNRHISDSVEGVVSDALFAATAASRMYVTEGNLHVHTKWPHNAQSEVARPLTTETGIPRVLAAFSHEKLTGSGSLVDIFDFLVQESNGAVRVVSYDGVGGGGGEEYISFPVAGVKLQEVVASKAWKVGPEGLMRWWKLYALDEQGTVWLIRQRNIGYAVDGVTWHRAVPVLRGVKALSAPSAFTTRQAALFYAQGDDRRLRLKVQDYGAKESGTGLWREVDVHGPSEEIFEVSRHRVEAVLLSDRDAPLPNTEVVLSACAGSSACEVFYQGKSRRVSPEEPVKLVTDALGRVTISVTPNGLAVPRLALTTTSRRSAPVTQVLRPGLAVYQYLAGEGTLDSAGGGRGKFDDKGSVLRQLKQDLPAQRATKAATAIREVAARGLTLQAGGTAGNGTAWEGQGEGQPAGLWVSMSDDEPWAADVLQTAEDLDAFYESASWNFISDAWSGVQHIAGDIYQGLKDGVVQLHEAVIHYGKPTADLLLKIKGDPTPIPVRVAFEGIEEAGHIIAGLLHRIGVAVKKALDWLKATFSFDHIWNTKMAFEKALGQVEPIINGGLDKAQTAVHNWITDQKQGMERSFNQAREVLTRQGGGNKKLSVLHNEQKEHIGGKDPGTLGGAQQNWLTDKVTAARPTLPTVPEPPQEAQSAWNALLNKLKTNEEDFVRVAQEFFDAFQEVLENQNHGRLENQTLNDLLTSVEGFVTHLLDTAQGLLDEFFELLKYAVDGFTALMNTELPLGPLNTLWAWIAKAAGHPGDGKLTLASLISLMAAVPVTLLYKAVKADPEAQLFPPTQYADSADLLHLNESEKKAYRVAAALGLLAATPLHMTGDVLGSAAPWQFSVGMAGASAIIFAMAHADLTWKVMTTAASKEVLPFIGPIGYGVASVALFFFQPLRALWEAFKYFVPIVLSAVGGVVLFLAIYAAATERVTEPEAIMASIIGTFPLVFSFLNFEPIRESNLEYALPVKVFFTGWGNESSGLLNAYRNWG